MEVRGSHLGYNDDQLIPNPLISGFINYFCGPAETVLLTIAIIFVIKKIHRKFSLIALACVVAGVVASGGRIIILYAIIQVIVALSYYRISVSKKAKKQIALISVLSIVGVVFLTTLRTSNSVLQSMYSYFSIPVALLSYFSGIIDVSGFQSYGAAFLYPIFYIWDGVSSFFGSSSLFLQNLIHYVGLPQNTWVNNLFPTGDFNAFSSMFYFFYMDFRIFGVALFSGLYGLITGIVYRKAYSEHNQKYFLWYMILLRTMFGSFIIWQLGNTKFVVSMVLLLIAQLSLRNNERNNSDKALERESGNLGSQNSGALSRQI